MVNPCARESKVRPGRFVERKLISDSCQISSYVSQYLERRTGNIPGALSKRTRGFGLPDAGSGGDFTAKDPHHR